MNPSGSHHHAPAAGYQHHIQQRASMSAAKHHAPQPDAAKSQSQLVGDGAPPRDATTLIATPTYRDVLNGRGQGVQRHPGNVKYRALVYVNKVRKYFASIAVPLSSGRRLINGGG